VELAPAGPDWKAAFARIEGDAIVLHTDLLRLRIGQRGVPLDRQMADLFHSIRDAFGGRTLLFPTFNYDYGQTRVYDPEADPCQVGALNEFVRRRHPALRTLTPIFNFCILDNRGFSLGPTEDPFSEESTFSEMARCSAAVAFLGASFGANTFLHYVEEAMSVGYRYQKPLPGVIRREGSDRPIAFHYRVRPQLEGAVEYDWERLEGGLAERDLLHEIPLGGGRLLWFRADRVLEAWSAHLAADELYFLTGQARATAERLYERFGRPLRYEAVEPAA